MVTNNEFARYYVLVPGLPHLSAAEIRLAALVGR
jgi:hypothetical protein